MAISEDSDQRLHSVESDQGLHCLFRPVHLNTKGYYGMCWMVCKQVLAIVQVNREETDHTEQMYRLFLIFIVHHYENTPIQIY